MLTPGPSGVKRSVMAMVNSTISAAPPPQIAISTGSISCANGMLAPKRNSMQAARRTARSRSGRESPIRAGSRAGPRGSRAGRVRRRGKVTARIACMVREYRSAAGAAASARAAFSASGRRALPARAPRARRGTARSRRTAPSAAPTDRRRCARRMRCVQRAARRVGQILHQRGQIVRSAITRRSSSSVAAALAAARTSGRCAGPASSGCRWARAWRGGACR